VVIIREQSILDRPLASLVITTHNRKEDLRRALASAARQTIPLETIVLDDASDDGTAEMVRAEFPSARLEVQSKRVGYIHLRNLGASLARAPVIFSIDDDAVFTTPLVVAQTLREFDHPRIGAVAIPFVDVRISPLVRQRAPRDEGVFITAMYIGTAHAIRRDVFFEVGQYRDFFVHQFEEPDFCRRMMAKGYFVRLGRSDVIHHFFSPKRDLGRLSYYNARNNILLTWCTAPWPNLLWRLPRSITGSLLGVTASGRRAACIRGVLAGAAGVLRFWGQRTPVSRRCWHLLGALRSGPIELEAAAKLIRAGLDGKD